MQSPDVRLVTEAAQAIKIKAETDPLKATDAAHDQRLDDLEVLGGLTPGDVNDATTASLIRNTSSETNSELNAAIGYVPGVVADGVTDNRAAIQAALDKGGRWMLPAASGEYLVDGELNVHVPGTECHFASALIRQKTAGMSTFRAIAPDCLIEADITGVDGPPDFTGLNTSWEGSITASRWCGINIYATAHRLRIPWLRGRGMSAPVRSGGWDPDTNLEATFRVQDVEIGTILCERVEFGFAFKSTERIKIGRVVGTYGDTATLPRPPHLTYFANDTAGNGHLDPWLGEAVAHNGVNGQAFQFKGITGGKAGKLHARDCAGVLNIMETISLDIDEVVSRGDNFTTQSGGSVTIDNGTEPTAVRIRRTEIEMSTDYRAFHELANNGGIFDEIVVHTDHQVANGSDQYDVIIAGSNNTVGRVDVFNNPLSPEAWPAVVIWGTAPGNVVNVGKLEGVKIGVDGRTSPTARFNYDAEKIILHPTKGANKVTSATAVGQVFVSEESRVFGSGWNLVDLFVLRFGSLGFLHAANSGQAWTRENSGQWLVANESTGISTDVTESLATIDPGFLNVMVEATVTFDNADGILLRFNTTTDYLSVRLRPTAVEITDRATVLATVPRTHQPGRKYVLGAAIFGNVIDAWVDGEKVLSHTLDATLTTKYATGTRTGFRTSTAAAQFSRLRARQL